MSGVRLELGIQSDSDEVAEIICESYCLLAPKSLVKKWEESQEA